MRTNNLDPQYQELLRDILFNGNKKGDRTGTGTTSVFGRQIRHKMYEGFPLLTSKKMAWKQIKTELSCFINGITDIRYLWKQNCHIWDGDWYREYKKSCSSPYDLSQMIEFGLKGDTSFHKSIWEMGPIYGKQWRDWDNIDQLNTVINTLYSNPDDRRMIISAWNVGELKQMILPPCHILFQFYTRELSFQERVDLLSGNSIYTKVIEGKRRIYGNIPINYSQKETIERLDNLNVPKRAISLQWYQRSVDTPLGLPFNIASYGLLLEMIANEVNMVPDELIACLGDTHIYSNQIEGVDIQLNRKDIPPLPTISIRDGIKSCLLGDSLDVGLHNYNPLSKISFPLSN